MKRGADSAITNAIDAHVDGERGKDEDEDDRFRRGTRPCWLMAHGVGGRCQRLGALIGRMSVTWVLVVERVTRIELALSAWEVGVAGRA
jgi:hypothetical protein